MNDEIYSDGGFEDISSSTVPRTKSSLKAVTENYGVSVVTAEHTYTVMGPNGPVFVASYGYITVTSHDSSPKPYISRMPYSVEGEHYNPPSIYIVTFEPGNGDSSFTQDVIPGNRATDPETPVWEGHRLSSPSPRRRTAGVWTRPHRTMQGRTTGSSTRRPSGPGRRSTWIRKVWM